MPDADGAVFIDVDVSRWGFTLGAFGITQLGTAHAHSFSVGEGGGGGAAGTGGAAGATGTGAGTPSPSATTVPVQPQAPVTGQTNPGVTPSAPTPAGATAPTGTSPSAPQSPGFASSGHRQPRTQDAPQGDANSPDPIKELDKQIDRKLSICRGC